MRYKTKTEQDMEEETKRRILSLEQENDRLTDELIDLKFKVKQSKENELLDFIRTLYREVKDELECKDSKLTKRQILTNISSYLKKFAKDNHLPL